MALGVAASQAEGQLIENSSRSVVLRHGDADDLVPHEEVRVIPEGDTLMVAGGRSFTTSDIRFQKELQGNGPIEHPVSNDSDADGVIIELREPSVISLYAQGLSASQGVDGAQRSLSAEEAQVLDEQRIRIMQQQDFVLNRLGRLAGNAPLGVGNALSAPIIRFDTALNALVLHDVSIREVEEVVRSDAGLLARVERVLPDKPVYADLATSVPQIHAPKVWEQFSAQGVALNGIGVRIGILDTGVDYTHSDLGGCFGTSCKVVGGYDFVNRDGDPMDDQGHGTHCAATAAGDGIYVDSSGKSTPVRGVAPGATLYAYKVLAASGSGKSSSVIAALERCADPNLDGDFSDRLDVCSLSLGGPGDPDDPISRAADAASRAGVAVVIAAGNSGPSAGTIGSPGTARLAITVAAACKPDSTSSWCATGPIASFSSRGPIPRFPTVAKPDVAAPGVSICAARFGSFAAGNECLGGAHVAISGTSMATPHVAGVAALLKQAHPNASPETIKTAIMSTATDLGLPRETQGAGLIHAFNALQALGIPSSIARISGAPVLFDITPSTTISEVSQSIVLTSLATVPLEFVSSFSTREDGVSAIVTPDRALVAPGASVTFNIRTRVDLSKVSSGIRWSGRVSFTSVAGEVSTAVFGNIRDRLVANVKSIDLGVKNGFDLSWRDTVSVRLTNLLTDAGDSYQVSASCCGTGTSFTSAGIRVSAGSSSITIPPGGSVDLPLTFQATGTDSGNGRYRGQITLSSPRQTIVIPVTLFKGWAFRFLYETGKTVPTIVNLHSQSTWYYELPADGDAQSYFLVVDPGPWQADAFFSTPRDDVMLSAVFKTNVNASQTLNDLVLREDEARQTIDIKAHGSFEGRPDNGTGLFAITNSLGKADLVWWNIYPSRWKMKVRVNTFEPNIVAASSAYDLHESTILAWQHLLVGDSRSTDITMGGDPFVTKFVSAPSNEVSGDGTSVAVFACVNRWCIRRPDKQATIPAGQVGTLHISSNQKNIEGHPLFSRFASSLLHARPSSRDEYSSSPLAPFEAKVYLSPTEAFARVFRGGGLPFRGNRYLTPAVVPAGYADSIALGAGPEANAGTWYNYADTVGYYFSLYGFDAPTYLSTGAAADVENTAAERRIRYSFQRNSDPSQSGSFRNGTALGRLFSPGSYRMTFERTSFNNGVPTQSKAENSFTIVTLDQHNRKPVDENPPALNNLMLVANGLVQSVLVPRVSNTLYFGLEARPGLLRPATTEGDYKHDLMPDGLRSVSLEQSANGKDWIALAVETVSEGKFKAALPEVGASLLYHYRISAADIAGNSFTYTFQLPVGEALVIPTPTPEPTPTPTPTPDSDSSPTYTPTPAPSTSTTPGISGTPQMAATFTPGSNFQDSRAGLPKPRIRARRKMLLVSLPAMASIDLRAEQAQAITGLRSFGLGEDDVAKFGDKTQFNASCILSLTTRKRVRAIPVELQHVAVRKVRVGRIPRAAMSISYSCKFSLKPPYKVELGPPRRSAVLVYVSGKRRQQTAAAVL